MLCARYITLRVFPNGFWEVLILITKYLYVDWGTGELLQPTPNESFVFQTLFLKLKSLQKYLKKILRLYILRFQKK